MKYTWGNIGSPWLSETISCWGNLFADAKKKTVRKNTVIYCEGDDVLFVYLVEKGRFRISSFQEDGNEKQLYIAEVGAICGECCGISKIPHTTTALAIVDSEISYISYSQFNDRIHHNPELMNRILQFETRKVHLLQKQVLSLSFAPAYMRIARTLLDLYHLYGEKNEKGHCINLRFTKNELASLVGTSRVTTSSELSRMEQNNILMRTQGCYIILNMNALIQMAGY